MRQLFPPNDVARLDDSEFPETKYCLMIFDGPAGHKSKGRQKMFEDEVNAVNLAVLT